MRLSRRAFTGEMHAGTHGTAFVPARRFSRERTQGAVMPANFHIPLTAERRAAAGELQATLVDLLNLTLIGKHAHWNVEGRMFRSVHRELDELVEAWRTLSDDVAERAVAIGASPDGQVEAIAGATALEPLPSGPLSDRQVIRAIGDRLADVARRTRPRIDRVAHDDPVSCDLLIQVLGTLEKQLWMIRAQIADSSGPANDASAIRADARNGGFRS
jgi:starvation-inducible DNA-binding protein